MSPELLALAKEHFGYLPTAPDCTIPKPYLKELQRHILQYPWDINFTIKRQPKQGFGTLTCLETGCQISIDLPRLEDERDGGKKGGVGSLSAFEDHIESHPTHKKACLRRVKANKETFLPGNLAMGMNARVPNAVPARLLVGGDDPNRRASARYTMELPVPTIPRKRHSDSALAHPPRDLQAKEESASPPKKARREEPKSPLANNNGVVNHTPALVAPVSVDDLRDRLREVLASISRQTEIYDRAQRKKQKTKSDLTRISTYAKRLAEQYKERDELKAQITSHSTVTRAVIKPESTLSTQPQRQAGPSNTNGHIHPADAVIDSSPDIKVEEQKYGLVDPNSFYGRRPTMQNSQKARQNLKMEPAPTTLNSISHRPLVKAEAQANAVALGSSLSSLSLSQTSSITRPIPGPSKTAVKHEYVEESVGLLASSSQHSIPPAPIPQRFLVKEELLAPLRERVIPALPPRPKVLDQSEPALIASSSKAVASHPWHPPMAVPVASSSKILPACAAQPYALKYEDWEMLASGSSDDDDDDDYDEMAYNALLNTGDWLAQELCDRVGMDVPPPIRDVRDEDGLYYGRGRDTYVGPKANAADIDQFLVMAGNSEQFDSNASVAEALVKLGLKSQYDPIPGMEIALMPHQAIGVAWMLDREAGIYKGGCLADDMGLGKTVQMIAVMVKNRPANKKKTNLIVAPVALLDQWKFEIETKTNCGLKVLIYHGSSRPRRKADLESYDVVLTTFSTMANEWPDYEKEAKQKEKARKQKKRENSFIAEDSDNEGLHQKVQKRKERSGLLFQMEFYRIILDEGHQVRNRRTRVSRACSELTSEYRWCLTGTPIINSLTDCYGYIRFLKIRPWYDWSDFNDHIALKEKKNPRLAVSRLQAILSAFQLRRTKESKLDGKKLIELPDKTIELTTLEFTKEEADIYKMVEARSQATFNRYLRAGTVLKNYTQVLVLLLRLRQICSHPCLIQENVGAFVAAEDVDHSKPEVANDLTRAAKLVSPEFVADMQRRMKECMLKRMEAEKKSADAALEGEDCPICLDVMDGTAVVTDCGHAFCRQCIIDVLDNPTTERDNEVNRAKDERPCPVCRASISRKKLFTRSAFEPTKKELNPEATNESEDEAESTDDNMDVDEAPVSRKGKGRAVARKRAYYEDDDDDGDDDEMSDFIVEDDEDEEEKDARRASKLKSKKRRANVILDSDEEDDEPEVQAVLLGTKSKAQLEGEVMEKMPRFLPSTKMKYMMKLIEKSFKERPDEKILVVSQWTACLSLVSDYLIEKNIGHVKYQGDMNRDKRDQAVRVFMSKDKAKIMLMSLKCGGVGLNLTRANNVISLDLAWSRAIESQAWDRVHRLGQIRPVNVQRLVIAETVEDRIMALQERKQSLADGSLGEGKGKKIGKLTVRELANLFGLDDRGQRLHAQ